MHPNDDAALRRMYGWESIPRHVEEEYQLRLGMYHRGGASGPLGLIGLIDLARHLGCAPPAPQKAAAETLDWRNVPTDGSARVAAYHRGAWRPGTFLGFVASGTLAVRLGHDPMVQEFRPVDVRLTAVAEEVDRDDEELAEGPCYYPKALVEVDGEPREALILEADQGEGALVQVDGEEEPRRIPGDEVVE